MTRFFGTLMFFISVLCISAQSVRSIDGSFNNVFNPEWGATGDALIEVTRLGFADGYSEMGGVDRPNPRFISNRLLSQPEAIFDEQFLSDFTWSFGQFIDHDLVFVDNDPTEAAFIKVPEDDKVFSSQGPGIAMSRSARINGTGVDINNPRKYANRVTAFLDGSGVYGSDKTRARWLRTLEGGKLKMSNNGLLPWNTITGDFNDRIDDSAPFMDDATHSNPKLFVAGDVRANENPLLIAIHTIFVREHNRLCDELSLEHPDWTDEQLYQEARRWVSAFIQKITFYDWLPTMGLVLPAYRGYRDNINPQISNLFSAAAFRMGHTLINSNILRMTPEGRDIAAGSINLKDAFFNPVVINLAGGLDPYLRGMASQVQQKMDCRVIDDVRNFLFGIPGAGGLDLAAININRGRERGLPDYNTVRIDLGLPALKSFDEINSNPISVAELKEVYKELDKIDPWVGMLSEDYMPGAMFGATIMTSLEKQFQALRDGDRFYFEADRRFSESDISRVMATNFRDIIMRNTDIRIMQENVFKAIPATEIEDGPEIAAENLAVSVYPNPTLSDFSVKVFVAENSEITMTLYNIEGRKITKQNHRLIAGNNIIPMVIDQDLSSGVYHLKLEKDKVNYTLIRVFKQ